ncbi:hypothetical protein [Streptomyces sp. NPDC006668]|uniref:hypothetical protein n=1 Tax=Streptomyces sp. NPDC006668 TaxID=3156903 RepID=UPI0034016FBD
MDKRSLAQMAQRFREAEQRAEILRQELAVAIRQADVDGVAQKDISEATGYTRQQIRRIVLASGDATPAQVEAAVEWFAGLGHDIDIEAPEADAHGRQVWRCRKCGSHVAVNGQGKPHSPSGKARCAREGES